MVTLTSTPSMSPVMVDATDPKMISNVNNLGDIIIFDRVC